MPTSDDRRPGRPRVFISYRRDDSAGHAGRLYDAIRSRLGDGAEVFMDVDSIQPGVNFLERIQSAVGSCDVLLAVIGPQWSTATAEGDRRRLDDPSDLVRVEIEAALARGVQVVPVLVHGARMPGPRELPPSLTELSHREAIEMSDARWSFDVDRLVQSIEPAPASPKGARILLTAAMTVVVLGIIALFAWQAAGDGSGGPPEEATTSTEPTSATISEGETVSFSDPLIGPANNWKIGSGNTCAFEFTETGYRIHSEPEFTCASLPGFDGDLQRLVSTTVEVDVRFVSDVATMAEDPPAFGLSCRTDGSGEGSVEYFVRVYSTGDFSAWANDGTGFETGYTNLGSGSNPSFASETSQWRHMRLDCTEDAEGRLLLSAWLDGKAIVEGLVVDDPLPPASVALWGQASETAPADVEFRDLSIAGVPV